MLPTIDHYTVPRHMNDLYLNYYGSQSCPPEHLYGPAMRDHYLYVLVMSGKGLYRVRNRDYPLQAGQAFVLFPNELTMYRADDREPWEYLWFGFGGKLVHVFLAEAGIDIEHPIILHAEPQRLHRLFGELFGHESGDERRDELFYTGCLNSMLAEICFGAKRESHSGRKGHGGNYIIQAQNFIEQHYDKNIQVHDVAAYVGLERSYFSKLFKAATGIAPYEYVMDLRLSKGKQLLRETDMPVEHIALLLGFKDTFHFSSFFKRKAGEAPLHHRRKHWKN
ncbi:AraC family transcriptional regulator [Paenibacillus nasutitermitis]|uniref:AraC family transcriptional regulator n=1 Tax=Paenibacillus nasutitermitis TaxID=1652958 RepID=A0A916YLI0_9BACL|nr:AraC family transcriptional regulator [Paenibacillus nasutitermitis]GGD51095.1 AraC family transcriptional regulator [Paenibacillus nasutitermitis]